MSQALKLLKAKKNQDEISEIVNRHFIKRRNDRDKLNNMYIHPSGLAYCERAIMYSFSKGVPSLLPDPQLQMIMDSGTDAHERWQTIFREEGNLIERIKCLWCGYEYIGKAIDKCPECDHPDDPTSGGEIAIKDDDLNISMKCDGILEINDKFYLLEIKTISKEGYEYRLREKCPDEKHIMQAYTYLYLLEKHKIIKQKIDNILFIYVNRSNSGFKTFKLDIDEKYFENNLLGKINLINDCLKDETLPERPYDKKNNTECKRCRFQKECWVK